MRGGVTYPLALFRWSLAMTLPADHPRLKKRPFSRGELLADGIVHAVALLAGVIAFAVLLGHVLGRGEIGTFAALAV